MAQLWAQLALNYGLLGSECPTFGPYDKPDQYDLVAMRHALRIPIVHRKNRLNGSLRSLWAILPVIPIGW